MAENEHRITASLLKSKSGEFDLESIHTLNLSHMDITDLGCLGECSSLERLDLSFNDVTKLYALAGLTNLTDLNLSANRITSLDGMQSLENLKSLNLSGNLIGSIETLKCLSTLEKLTYLRLRDVLQDLSNPICMNISYKQDVLSILPSLVSLDDERLKGHGKEMFRLCLEIDSVIKESEKENNLPATSVQWLPDDYWTEETRVDPTQTKLEEAEKRLEDLLAECKDVITSADEKMMAMTNEDYTASNTS